MEWKEVLTDLVVVIIGVIIAQWLYGKFIVKS